MDDQACGNGYGFYALEHIDSQSAGNKGCGKHKDAKCHFSHRDSFCQEGRRYRAGCKSVKAQVDEEYAKGRNTVMGDDELDSMVRLADKRRHKLLGMGSSK